MEITSIGHIVENPAFKVIMPANDLQCAHVKRVDLFISKTVIDTESTESHQNLINFYIF